MEEINRSKLDLLTLENEYKIVLSDLNGLTAIEYLEQNPDLNYNDVPNYFWKVVLHKPDGNVLYAPFFKSLKFPKLGDSVWQLDVNNINRRMCGVTQNAYVYCDCEIPTLIKETVKDLKWYEFCSKELYMCKGRASKHMNMNAFLYDGLLSEFFVLFERRVPDYVTFDAKIYSGTLSCEISSFDRKLFKFHNFKQFYLKCGNPNFYTHFETFWFSHKKDTVSLITGRIDSMYINASHDIHGEFCIFGDFAKITNFRYLKGHISSFKSTWW